MPSFLPPKRILMGPGPSDVSEPVLKAMCQHTIGHLDPAFQSLMEDIKSLLKYAFQTDNRLTFPLSAPGSAGMEACFVNLVEPGDKVIICQNGAFGGRMKENVERCGGVPVMVLDDWGRAITVQKLEDALKGHPDCKIVAFVHAETSTGALSDAAEICSLSRQYGCLTIVDAVTSLGGNPLYTDDWGIDAIYSGSQKCLSCPPGISPVSFSDRALDKVKARKSKVQSWFLDLNLIIDYWDAQDGTRSYHHTAPVNALYGLHESLHQLKKEGLDKAWARHRSLHEKLREGLESLNLSYLVPAAERLPQLNSIYVPGHVENEANFRSRLLEQYNLEIGAGLGTLSGKIWRVGLMGHSARTENIRLCLRAFDELLRK